MEKADIARDAVGLSTRKYPSILVPLLFKSTDTQVVTSKALELWHDPLDLEYHGPALRRIIPQAITGQPGRLEDNDLWSLEAMILDLVGEQVVWYGEGACCPPADPLLRVIMLSQLYNFEGAFLDPLFLGTPVYCWLNPGDPVAQVLAAATFDFVLTYGWCYLPDLLFAHVAVSLSAGVPLRMRAALAAKLDAEESWEEMGLYYRRWTDRDPLAVLSKSWTAMQKSFDGSIAFSESVWAELVTQWAETMSWLGQLLSTH
jgi:hypothetical protein